MRTEKAIKNIILALIYQAISIVCGLIIPRLILNTFGSTYNGVINSATNFISIISILTLGITGATRFALYGTLSKKDNIGTSRIMKATKIYMRKVAIALFIYVLFLCIIYPQISHNDLTAIETTLIIFIVSISTFAQYFFGISNQTLLQADQANYIIYIQDTFKIIVNCIIVYILVKLKQSIFIVELGSSIVFFITPFIMNYYVKKKYNLTNHCEPDNTGIKGRKDVAFLSVANLIHNNIDIALLTIFTDAKNISVYTVYYLVIGKIKSLMNILTSGMEAAFGSMWAKGEKENIEKNFNAFEFVLFFFTTIVFSCVGLLILDFVKNYTNGITDVNYIKLDLAILITFAEAFYCYRQPYMTLVQAAGFYKETKVGSAIEAIINLVISIILMFIIGMPGVIIGTLVANIFRTMQYAIFVSKNILNRNFLEVVKKFIWSFGCATIICLFSIPIINKINYSVTWSSWIVESLIVFGISCMVATILAILFYKSTILFIYNKIKLLLKNKKRNSKHI